MGFQEAVVSVLSKYATFSGRASRSEFWWYSLFTFLVSLVLAVIDDAAFGVSLLGGIFSLAVLLPGLAVSARRLHDIGRSGWWILIIFVPLIGAIVLLIWYATKGTPAPNEYGGPV